MAALTAERYQTRRDAKEYSDPVAAATKIWAGAIVVLNASGDAAPASTATGLIARGVAKETVDNTGAAGDLNVTSRPGVFRFANSAGADEITRAEIGDDCYLVDDQTVAKTDGTSTRSVGGKVVDVDANGVWVALGIAD
jgi:hypothetical protein